MEEKTKIREVQKTDNDDKDKRISDGHRFFASTLQKMVEESRRKKMRKGSSLERSKFIL